RAGRVFAPAPGAGHGGGAGRSPVEGGLLQRGDPRTAGRADGRAVGGVAGAGGAGRGRDVPAADERAVASLLGGGPRALRLRPLVAGTGRDHRGGGRNGPHRASDDGRPRGPTPRPLVDLVRPNGGSGAE